MLPKLTLKQYEFVRQLAVNPEKPTEAYCKSHDVSNMKRESIHVEAQRLLKNPNVAPWVEYMQQKAQEVAIDELNYSIKDCFNEVDEMKKIALDSLDKNGNPNVNAAIKAVELKGRLSGHFVEKQKVETVGLAQMLDKLK